MTYSLFYSEGNSGSEPGNRWRRWERRGTLGPGVGRVANSSSRVSAPDVRNRGRRRIKQRRDWRANQPNKQGSGFIRCTPGGFTDSGGRVRTQCRGLCLLYLPVAAGICLLGFGPAGVMHGAYGI
uniref:Uncharacterized protein n=1 Tax=Molossus molossus TaxID=27622 RepID=A0A7J8FSD6_MOLMO|nr:hypothetical protein HJG59_008329 [Molossus molossus]